MNLLTLIRVAAIAILLALAFPLPHVLRGVVGDVTRPPDLATKTPDATVPIGTTGTGSKYPCVNLSDDDVQEVPIGYIIQSINGFVDKSAAKRAPDARYYLCETAEGHLELFVPPDTEEEDE